MKKLAFIFALVALSSCGKKSEKSPTDGAKERFQNALSTLTVGQSTNVRVYGKERTFSRANPAETKNVNQDGTSIVLKIDGSLVYVYETTVDHVSRRVSRKVVIHSYDMNDLQSWLDMPGAVINGNVLSYKNSGERYSMSFPHSIKEDYSTQFRINFSKPLCESTSYEASSGKYTLDNVVTILPFITYNEVKTCGRIYNRHELKAIDLSNIQFCDESEDYTHQCEMNANLSWITAEL